MNMRPIIYVFINSGRGTDWVSVLALSEDGHILAGHICSHEGFIPEDMGLNSDRKHDLYGAKYPDGYALKYIDDLEAKSNEGFRAAVEMYKERAKAKQGAA